jgi:hypothetical protein
MATKYLQKIEENIFPALLFQNEHHYVCYQRDVVGFGIVRLLLDV